MNSWMEDVILNRALELEKEKKDEFWFSIAAIANVPYISFPGLNEVECQELQEQTKEVLRISHNRNHYKEVAITYDLRQPVSDDKYKVVLGNIASANISQDAATSNLLNTADIDGELVVISLHNHPNNSLFSISDLMIFAEHPSIKIMEIVNKNGEVAFLIRPQFEKYPFVIDTILDAEPNFVSKLKEFHTKHPQQNAKITDIISSVELRKEIIKIMIEKLEQNGVYVHNYVNNEQAKNIDFSTFPVNREPEREINESGHSSIEDYEYFENGEDGYEWEER